MTKQLTPEMAAALSEYLRDGAFESFQNWLTQGERVSILAIPQEHDEPLIQRLDVVISLLPDTVVPKMACDMVDLLDFRERIISPCPFFDAIQAKRNWLSNEKNSESELNQAIAAARTACDQAVERLNANRRWINSVPLSEKLLEEEFWLGVVGDDDELGEDAQLGETTLLALKATSSKDLVSVAREVRTGLRTWQFSPESKYACQVELVRNFLVPQSNLNDGIK